MTEEDQPPQQIVLPQPQYGVMPTQSLEVTEHFTTTGVESHRMDKTGEVVQDGFFPPQYKKFFWGFINPDITTSILSEKDVMSIYYDFQAERDLFFKRLSPKYIEENGYTIMGDLNNMGKVVTIRARKALNGVLLERLTQQTSVSVLGQGQGGAANPQQRQPGWVDNIKSKLFGRGGF
jgi:hypothetical protein